MTHTGAGRDIKLTDVAAVGAARQTAATQTQSWFRSKPSTSRLKGFQVLLHGVLIYWVPFQLWNISQQMSSCWISGRVQKGGSLKEKAPRPAFSSPWPGHLRNDPITSSSGDGAGLSGSDSDWLVSGSSKEDGDLLWRCGWEWGQEFSQGWLRHSSAVALFLYTQTQ